MQSLLNAIVDFPLLAQGYEVPLDWLGQFARVIIEGVGIVGLGIIVFSLVLKAITLPLDIYQRVKMRKQNLVMESMKDDLDKLQKQYANDKDTYNQKMMELYKKNGYSIFGTCLPMILSIVILIVAFQGFRAYSQYANLQLFTEMSNAYNAAILENGIDGPDYTLRKDEEGKLIVDGEGQYSLVYTEEGELKELCKLKWENGAVVEAITDYTYTMSEVGGNKYFTVSKEDKYIQYRYNLEAGSITREYQMDTEKMLAVPEVKEAVDGIKAQAASAEPAETLTDEVACNRYLVKVGSTAAKEAYYENSPSFLWVKNVWYPDVSYNHPVPDYKTFSSQLSVEVTFRDTGTKAALNTVINETQYNNLVSELSEERNAPNGYFILIILSIGMMVLSQFLTMRSQKASNQYQTVDGQGAVTQKVMLVMMPLIYAVFAFLYSAAFSIYMTFSSVIALAVTLISNFALGRVFKKKEEQKIKETYGRKLAWMKDEDDSKKPKKEIKDKRKASDAANEERAQKEKKSRDKKERK